MFICCVCRNKDNDTILGEDNIPELGIEDIKMNPPHSDAGCDKWSEYLISLNGWNIEYYKKVFYKLDNLAKNHLMVDTIGRFIYNYRNCKKTLKKLKKRERIKREISALRINRNSV